MASSNFPTENASFRKLVSNGNLYRVPQFQRDYAWDEEQWEELWLDAMDVIDGKEDDHYLGYLVLHRVNREHTYEIIDGQQRIVTLSLVVLAACRILKGWIDAGQEATDNQVRLRGLMRTYIGDVDPVTLSHQTKLTLNRNNNDVFATRLVELETAPRRGIRESSITMGRARDWLQDRISRRFKTGHDVARFVQQVADSLFFTVIEVDDEVKAYRVFETLNARGVQLSSADLLKNRLFALVHEQSPTKLPAMEKRWAHLVDRVEAQKLVEFLSEHLMSRGWVVRKRDLYRQLRKRVQNAEDAFRLIREMEDDLDTWLNLVTPAGSDWGPELRKRAELLRVFRVRQPIPLLLAVHRTHPSLFARVLDAVLILSVRYNVIGRLPPSEQEEAYGQAARGVTDGRLTTRADILGALASIYPSDSMFESAFAQRSFHLTSRNKRVVRYLLHALERGHWNPTPIDLASSEPSIEHLLPQSPGEGWEHVSDVMLSAVVDRLGNLTLLEARLNRDLGNVDWQGKQPVLAMSAFTSTRETAERYTERWDETAIDNRQLAQAKKATQIWRLD